MLVLHWWLAVLAVSILPPRITLLLPLCRLAALTRLTGRSARARRGTVQIARPAIQVIDHAAFATHQKQDEEASDGDA